MLMGKSKASRASGTITAYSLTKAVDEREWSMVCLGLGTTMASKHRKPVGIEGDIVATVFSGIARHEKSSISTTKAKPGYSISLIGLTNRRILLLFPNGLGKSHN